MSETPFCFPSSPQSPHSVLQGELSGEDSAAICRDKDKTTDIKLLNQTNKNDFKKQLTTQTSHRNANKHTENIRLTLSQTPCSAVVVAKVVNRCLTLR